MSHICKTLSDQEKTLNTSKKRLKTTDKNHHSVNRSTADCKCLNHCSKTEGQHKMKRQKSRKERNQMRGDGKEASKSRSHHRHCHRQTSIDMMHFQDCCYSSCHCPSRKEASFLNVVPTAQEPSIITDSRLIGHKGLFKNEVKSIDIERLLGEQKRLQKSGQQVQKKSSATSHPSTSHMPSQFSTNDEIIPFENKADLMTNTSADCPQKEDKVSQGSDLTPGQRSQQQLDPSSESFKSISSSKQLTPTVNRENVKTLNKKIKGHVIATPEHTPKNQESPFHQTSARDTSPSPVQLSSSSINVQHRRQDPDSVSRSVSAVAARLCSCLQFPFLRRRSLVADSREVLLKALQGRHGRQLQDNLLEVQRYLSFGIDPTMGVQDQEPAMVHEDEVIHTDTFTTTFHGDNGSQAGYDNKKMTSFNLEASKHLYWKPSPQTHHSPKQTFEWLQGPVKTSDRLLDDILRPPQSPQVCMDFEPPGVSASDHLFAPSSTSCWEEKASTSQFWEDRFDWPKRKEALMFGSFENSFVSHTRAVTKRISSPQYNDRNIQPFFPYQAPLPDRRSAEPVHFPQEREPFEADSHSFAPSFPAPIHHRQRRSRHPLHQFSHPTYRPLRSHHTDMTHYPPSHMLDRDTAHALSSLQSPEHWSFPPMRLY